MTPKTMISIGYGNYFNPSYLKDILKTGDARGNKVKTWASENSKLIDATAGRRARCILFMTSGHALLCP
jgi:regulator of extracellular matrix RemA (YlzA/DUF370 family)